MNRNSHYITFQWGTATTATTKALFVVSVWCRSTNHSDSTFFLCRQILLLQVKSMSQLCTYSDYLRGIFLEVCSRMVHMSPSGPLQVLPHSTGFTYLSLPFCQRTPGTEFSESFRCYNIVELLGNILDLLMVHEKTRRRQHSTTTSRKLFRLFSS